jgi:putative MATE family efflux protein
MAMHDLTSGPIRGHLIKMGAFMLLTMVVQTLYGLIDLYWVGRLGSSAIAAVSVAGNLLFGTLAFTQVLAVGTGALVAQAAGRKDMDAVRRLFKQSQVFGLGIGLVLTAVLYALRGTYAHGFASDAETEAQIRDFLFWFIPALLLQFPMVIIGSALRGVGDMRTASLAQIGSILLNIVLAPLLIFGWGTGLKLGVAGAALATLISVAAGVLGLGIAVIRRGTLIDLKPGWAPQFSLWGAILKIGTPSGVEFGLMTLYMGFVYGTLRPFGAADQAAFGIGMRVLQVGMMPAMAVSFASSAIVGQNFGAKLPQRVRQTFFETLKVSVVSVLVFVLLFHLVPQALLMPFTGDPAVLAAGEDFLRIISWNLLAMSVIFACFGVFTGLGNTIPSLIGSATRIGLIVGPAWWLSSFNPHFQPYWIWILSAGASLVQLGVNLFFVRREFRRRLAPVELAPAIAAA